VGIRLSESQALHLWRDVLLEMVRDDDPDLSIRQMAVLLTVYLDPPPHTVRGLAQKLGVTKPVITRALNAMSRHNLVQRRRDPNDRRNVLIQRTVEGSLYLERVAEMIRRAAEDLDAI
jgi:DNA-binding MarR family transcriptional regulator